ncbi:MAG TPA: FAD-dependent oxidoreductase, partial [Vulgatibacter sp.]
MRLRISNLPLWLDEDEASLRRLAAVAAGLDLRLVGAPAVVRKSLDCRRKGHPRFLYVVDVEVPDDAEVRFGPEVQPAPVDPPPPLAARKPKLRPIVVGTGPAGLFAALGLIERGIPSLILERGKRIDPRRRDVALMGREGKLDPESNMNFGEGGAGAYTDGKLTTRVTHPAVRKVIETFARFGAPDAILTDAKPHIGSDLLPGAVTGLREWLEREGCEVRFGARVEDVLRDEAGKVRGVRLSSGEELLSDCVILAPGNSARELYETLHRQGYLLEAKPFAVGFRAEHPQELVDRIQYGGAAGHPKLPPADYRLAENPVCEGRPRGVFSFCMCPGGIVVPTPTEPELLCVNGMSNSRRSAHFANSGIVVAVGLDDFERDGHGRHPLSGLAFQRKWEAAAYDLGGGGYRAPAQRITDYLQGRLGTPPGKTTYRPGLTHADLSGFLPAHVTATLKQALRGFDRKMRGWVTEEATLIAFEGRTSAPLRIVRGDDLQAPGATGLYPCGEGVGYA